MLVHRTISIIDHAKTGQIMRKKRKAARVSLRSAARHMDISANFLSCLERGSRSWTMELCQSFMAAVKEGK